MRGIAVSPASRLIQVASSFSLIQIPENIWKRVWKNFCSLELPSTLFRKRKVLEKISKAFLEHFQIISEINFRSQPSVPLPVDIAFGDY